MKKVSVIIPVYNTEEFLPICLNSILEQTYSNLEVIVVNDASTDSSQGVIETYTKKDARIVNFQFDEHKGAGAARNYGIEKSSGEFIYFLDSDDYIPEKTLELLMNYTDKYEVVRGKLHYTTFNQSSAVVLDGVTSPRMYFENRYNLIRNNSVDNYVISAKLIKENNCKFIENNQIYMDVPFLLSVMEHIEELPYVSQALYFKRHRYDPIYNPSIRQMGIEKKFNPFIDMYIYVKENYTDPLINNFIDIHLLNFYRKDMVIYLNKTGNIEVVYDRLNKAISLIDDQIIKMQDLFFTREINAIISGNVRKYKRLYKRYHMLRDLRNSLKSKYRMKLFVYDHIFSKLPIKKNLVFFESFLGKNYSDSPKYLYEYMKENNLKYKTVWSFNGKREVPFNTRQVERLSLKYFYRLARAKYWVSNARMPNEIRKRSNQVYLQTWHGTPLKRLAGDMENVLMPGTNPVSYKKNFKEETDQWDYLVSPNAYSSAIFERAFWFDNHMLEFGYPRNDVLYTKDNEKDINKIKNKLGLPKDKKVILYAPTWRDDEYYSKGNYRFSLKFDLNHMKESLGNDYVIVLRMHYLIASNLNISEYKGFVFDQSNYDDISELYLVSDILITDYSSVFFDYANLRRPILFYTYDIEKYKDELRGFYLNMETDLPGPLLKTTDEIVRAIEGMDELTVEYAERYEAFYNRFCDWDNGKASENIIKEVFKK